MKMQTKYEKYGWKSIKKEEPPIGEFVEVFYGQKQVYSFLCIDYAAIFINEDGDKEWGTEGATETECGGKVGSFGIKYWRYIRPTPHGKKAYLKKNGYGHLAIFFKKIKKEKK